ncbi:pirin family protein [Nocardioides sp. AE5]|uniref:pirin family protein n=1 Tax=Nocardioides sp. AE5 TaxID=2962573 RepID=UPI002882D026|nr:pirin family protein [Nocardioides sp. AE5]MDT0200360.1 pirin family protein [Nocardioides sp. AE5]
MEIHRSGDRFVTDAEGRRTRHSLSFGSHYDPDNLRFGLLVSHNDDLVQPGHGYPDHPHSNLEVVTWVLRGALVHADSRGHSGVIEPGRVQVMSAGAGVVHSETVDAASGPTRFLQAWVLPDEPGGPTAYDAAAVAPGPAWLPVASGAHPDAAVRIGARGATLYAAHLAAGQRITVSQAPFAHLFIATGAVRLGAGDLGSGDAARFRDEGADLVATSPTEALLWTFADPLVGP